MRLGRLSFDGMDRRTAEGESSCRYELRAVCLSPVRARAVLCRLGILFLALGSGLSAQAQDGGSPAVIVNQDILNNLEGAAAAAAGVRVQAGASATLLPPPETAPQSRVLVKPERQTVVTLPTPARKPAGAAETAGTPDPSAAESAAPDAEQEDTWSGFAITSEPSAADFLPAVPPPPEPPAAEETSLAVVPPPEPPAPPESATPSVAPPQPTPPAPAAATQTAMVLPPKLAAGEFRLLFESGATTLSEAAKGRLAALAEQLRAEPQRRIQVQAFAGGAEISARDARRVSLSRAVAVRNFLIEQGLSGRQIDVRALGSDSGSGPAHRVDVLDARG